LAAPEVGTGAETEAAQAAFAEIVARVDVCGVFERGVLFAAVIATLDRGVEGREIGRDRLARGGRERGIVERGLPSGGVLRAVGLRLGIRVALFRRRNREVEQRAPVAREVGDEFEFVAGALEILRVAAVAGEHHLAAAERAP